MSISSGAFMGIAIGIGMGIGVGMSCGLLLYRRLEEEKQQKQRKKISGGVEKIDRMLGDGKITEEEARELKQALGTGVFITPEKSSSDKHILSVSIIHILSGFLLIGASLLILSIRMILSPEFSGLTPLPVFETLNPITSVAFSIFLLCGFLQLTSAVFLLKRSRQARRFIIVFSILMLASFPLGTAFGIYSLWVLFFREGAEAYFPET